MRATVRPDRGDQSPSPGSGEKYLSNLPSSPLCSSASAGAVLLAGDVGPFGRIVGVELEPLLEPALGVGQDRLGRAFGLAHAAIDAFAGIDDEHVLALVEAIDRADLDAVHILAADAGVGDDVGHGCRLSPGAAESAKPAARRQRFGSSIRDIERARLGRRAAAGGQRLDPDHPDRAALRRSSARRRRGPAACARSIDAAVDPDAARLGERLGERCGSSRAARTTGTCRAACSPSAIARSPASAAKAWRAGRLRRCGAAAARGRARPSRPRSRARRGSRCRASAARPLGLQAERGGQRLGRPARPACRRAPHARGARAARPCRRGSSAARRAKAEPGEQARDRRRGVGSTTLDCGGSAGIGRAGGRGAQARLRQRIASGFSTAGTNRSSAPMRDAEPRQPRARCSRSSAASGPATVARATIPPSSTSSASSARTAARRRRILRGMAGGAQRRERALDLAAEPVLRAAAITASRPRCGDAVERRSSMEPRATAGSCPARAARPHGRARGSRPAARARCAA